MRLLDSLRLYQKWWGTWHTLPVRSWVRGAALYRAGNFAGAIPFYERGLLRYPNHPAALCAQLDLAYCLMRTGAPLAAREILSLAFAHAPGHRDACLRLAHVHMLLGSPRKAALLLRDILRMRLPDGEVVGSMLLALIQAEDRSELMDEALCRVDALPYGEDLHVKVRLARALIALDSGDDRARATLQELAHEENGSREAVLAWAEQLLRELRVGEARHELGRVLAVAPEHPRILSSLARCYLFSGQNYEPQYAIQLATAACRYSGWESASEMHVLAEAYYHAGDNISALLMASKAREAGSRELVEYSRVSHLDQMIQELSRGTHA